MAGIFDFLRRTGKAITAENVEAKARDVGAEISEKEALIASMRAGLTVQMLDGDRLGAHRIRHEEDELQALKLQKAELEATARELRASEAAAAVDGQWQIAAQKGRAYVAAAAALTATIVTVVAAARVLLAAHADFAAAVPVKARDWEVNRIPGTLARLIGIELYVRSERAIRPPEGVSYSPFELRQNPELNSIEGAVDLQVQLGLRGRTALRAAAQDDNEPAPVQANQAAEAR